MATMASAALDLQISVDGVRNVNETEVTMVPSGILTLDLWNVGPIGTGAGEGYFALAASMQGATISGGYIVNPANWTILLYEDAFGAGVPLPEGENGIFGGIFTPPATVFPADGTLVDGIIFHCEGPGDVIISLYELNGDTLEIMGVLDTVVVHQIPEPITMTLLGLGGLFLRRRK